MSMERFALLVEELRRLPGHVIVAFSGGVDSTLLARAALEAKGRGGVLLVTVDIPFLPRRELGWARRVAELLGARHVVLEAELGPEVWRNPRDRCYYCKKAMMGRVIGYAQSIYREFTVVDGTNADDLKGYRPGVRALRELGVRSPLAELGFTKAEIRALSKALGLPTWDRPSSPCLATRIPYGEEITLEKLRLVEAAEEVVKRVTGARIVRVRLHGGAVARIEVGRDERRLFFSEEVMDRVYEELRRLGIPYAALDLRGYRSGSMDEVLSSGSS